MKHADQIQLTGKFMVKEDAYTVGIYDIRYLAKCFKTKYGVTPLEFFIKSSLSQREAIFDKLKKKKKE